MMMSRLFYYSLLLCCVIVAVVACKNEKPTTAPTVAPANTAAATPPPAAAPAPAAADAQEIALRLAPYLKRSQLVEFQFYDEGISSETESKEQIAQFVFFLTNQPPVKKNCDFDGGITFKDGEGNIAATIDYAVKKGCNWANLTLDGKSSDHQFTDAGMNFLKQLLSVQAQSQPNNLPPQRKH